MKKIILSDESGASSDETIVIDGKEILKFAKDEDLLFNSLAEFMNKLPSHMIDGKPIKEWFRLREHSLWWFAHNALAPRIDEHIRFIIAFNNMLDAIRPDIVKLQGFYERADLIRQICKNKGVKLSIGVSAKHKIFLQSIKNRGLVKGSEIVAGQKRSKRIALARESKRNGVDDVRKGCVVYIGHETYRRRIYDFKTGEVREGEYIAQKLLQRVRESGTDVLGVDVDHTPRGEFRALKQRLESKDEHWVPFDVLESMPADRETEEAASMIRQTLAVLFKNKEFHAVFNFGGVQLWDTLSIRFDLLAERLPQRVRSIEAAKDLLRKLEPRSVFLLYEKGPSAMTFIVAADELGIKTVGMQHGMIYEWHSDYAIRDLRTGSSPLGSPIPTVMLVFGEYYMKLLTEKLSYPSDRVIVCGNPTYESAEIYSKQVDKKKVLAKLGLDPEKKTILVASSMGQKKHRQPDYDVALMNTMVKSFANQEGMQVMLKLHPKEDGEVYEKIIKESGAANFFIIDHPIEELILVCDLFLGVATTTIMEAIVLGKPVIIVKAFDKANRYVSSLIEKGAAIGATYEELADMIPEMLRNAAFAERLRGKRAEFAKQHFNLPDNSSSQRIANLLLNPGKDV